MFFYHVIWPALVALGFEVEVADDARNTILGIHRR